MRYAKRILNTLIEKAGKQSMPRITPMLISLGIGIGFLGRRKCSDVSDGTLAAGYIRRAGKRVWSAISGEEDAVATIPKQEQNRPALMFDSSTLLLNKRFWPFSMDFFVSRRAFADVFLFHAAHLYELIHVSESSTLFDRMMMHKMDPYGCISYKVYCRDKKRLEGKHLNRPLEKVVVICTKDNEYHSDFSQNVLRLNRWNGEPETGLFGLLNFLHSLYFSGINDFRPTLMSYTGKDFHKAFEEVQKAIFVGRNMFSWNAGRKYEGRVEEINKCRIRDYDDARRLMDKDVKHIDSNESGLPGFGSILSLAARVFFS
ncbi:hypothetical protein HK407_05g08630 [Ordospora pajunii]|uniref:uncharacterized protein n=1 Tax=Ordospora pajunii TaxID=3039483 RepID=UPI002952624C|nr:uncharacterized protein HK407_05g08630 [Ordospora pajunii]KAH9411488.1 hypothetical protein HK407_05g08630 [Ordospora pajunii]